MKKQILLIALAVSSLQIQAHRELAENIQKQLSNPKTKTPYGAFLQAVKLKDHAGRELIILGERHVHTANKETFLKQLNVVHNALAQQEVRQIPTLTLVERDPSLAKSDYCRISPLCHIARELKDGIQSKEFIFNAYGCTCKRPGTMLNLALLWHTIQKVPITDYPANDEWIKGVMDKFLLHMDNPAQHWATLQEDITKAYQELDAQASMEQLQQMMHNSKLDQLAQVSDIASLKKFLELISADKTTLRLFVESYKDIELLFQASADSAAITNAFQGPYQKVILMVGGAHIAPLLQRLNLTLVKSIGSIQPPFTPLTPQQLEEILATEEPTAAAPRIPSPTAATEEAQQKRGV
jgi:hypothetical protein